MAGTEKTSKREHAAAKANTARSIARAASAFTAQVEEALRHFHDQDAAWLGKHSPLAAPYFIGDCLGGAGNTPQERGRVLKQLLHEAMQALEGGEERLTADNVLKPQNILSLSFLDQQAKSRSLHSYIEAAYGIPKTTYYRNLSRALEKLSAELVQRVNPALRIESPPLRLAVIGRDDLLARCLQALQRGQSVGLTGPGGIGKTTLGARLAAIYHEQGHEQRSAQAGPQGQPFWFTVRPGLNDQPDCLLFVLAYFLHRQGSSSLWLQLVADGGKVNFSLAQGMLHHALQDLSAARPLLCFDELDLLRPLEIEAHAQLLTLLESLRGMVPLLCMSQYPVVETDLHMVLPELTPEQMQQLLTSAAIALPEEDRALVWHYTRGNPRLLELCLALYQSGESLEALPGDKPALLSYGFVLNRIWQRLGAEERELLLALAVFRRSAPGDGWNDAALHTLLARHLVQTDGRGGVEVFPAFRVAIESQLLPEQRDELHLQAAVIRAQRSEWTEAAYHYIRAGHIDMAVWLWDKQREQEIKQGQGAAALELFGAISSQQVNSETGAMLVALRSELKMLLGDYSSARRDVQTGAGLPPGIPAARLRRVEGDIADRYDEFADAIRAYRAGLDTVEGLMKESLLFRRDIAWGFARSGDLNQAWQEACRARYEAENMQGYVQERMGNYAEARAFFERALTLAEEVGDGQRAANIRNNLGRLLIWQGEYAAALHNLAVARAYCERAGYQTLRASILLNQAFGCLQAGQPADALETAAAALTLFEQFGEPWGKTVATLNLSEAYLGLARLDEAERYAWQVVQEEDTETIADAVRVLAEVRLAQQSPAAAEKLIRQSIEYARQNEDLFAEGYSWRVLASICRAQGDMPAAAEARERASALFQKLHMPHEVARFGPLDV